MPDTNVQGEKFVGRFEMGIMQFAILNKAQQQGGITKENLQQIFRGELKMEKDHLDHCLRLLVEEDHLKQEGNKYTVTDDGREDVQKVQHLILALPQVVNISGGQQRQTQTPGVGGYMGSQQGGNVGSKQGGQQR